MLTEDRPELTYQPALDGVRALAVAAVLAFHGGVAALAGGFLGVDAFFVLSGFLITSLLLAERARTGRIDLLAFWGRRARRLLPALLLLVAVVTLVARWTMPREELSALRWDALAAVAYGANWRMADRDGDYFAATGTPSPLQHTWSLGIEEQFYLLWPLVFLGVLALSGRRWRGPLLAVCALGAAGSWALGAALYRPDAVDRVYYGTDTRAVALLVGCGLAVALAGREPVRSRIRRLVIAGLATVGAGMTAVLWATAGGGDQWLFDAGLWVAAVAVAAVIAHVVISPTSTIARLLAVPPLVGLGRISYGVYLWHWPLFGWLTADRTGLTGPTLFAVRCAVTLVIAALSYRLLEMPLRNARWPRRTRRRGSAITVAGLVVTAATAVAATVPPPLPPDPPIVLDRILAAPTPSPRTESTSQPVPPIQRDGRKPGSRPRIAFLGDSVSWSLGTYLPVQDEIEVAVRAVQGCGIARLPEVRYIGQPHPNYPGCDKWDIRWRRAVNAVDPDVAAILLDRWELMDRKLDGEYRHVGDPVFDAYLNQELDLAIGIAGSRGARVAILTAPYTRRAERPDGGLWPEDQPERVDAWNRLLRAAAVRHGAAVIELNHRVCPDGEFTWNAGGVRIRSDGLHFTPQGVRQWIAPWLLPRLAGLTVTPWLAPSARPNPPHREG